MTIDVHRGLRVVLCLALLVAWWPGMAAVGDAAGSMPTSSATSMAGDCHHDEAAQAEQGCASGCCCDHGACSYSGCAHAALLTHFPVRVARMNCAISSTLAVKACSLTAIPLLRPPIV